MIDVGRDFERMQSYVAGRLSEVEQHSFEDRLAHDPALLREFEQWLRLREGLEHLQDKGYFNAIAGRHLRARAPWLPWVLAAGIAALAAFLWLQPHAGATALLRATLPVGRDLVPTASVTAHFTFVATRGATRVPDLNLPKGGLIELRATPPPAGTGNFRIELVRAAAGTTPRALAAVNARRSEDGYVYAYADAVRLEPGSYELHVSPQDASPASTESFRFKLNRSGAPP